MIFVHGLKGSAESWDALRAFLTERGWSPGPSPQIDCGAPLQTLPDADFYTMNMSDWNAGFLHSQNLTFDQQGCELGEVIDAVLAATGESRVAIVAHSMGGLAARSYLQGFVPSADPSLVDRLITIGTPHLGAPLASLCQQLPCIDFGFDPTSIAMQALISNSIALNTLNDVATHDLPEGLVYVSIVEGNRNTIGSATPGDGIVEATSQNLALVRAGLDHSVVLADTDCRLGCGCIPLLFPQVHTCETSDESVWVQVLGELTPTGPSGALGVAVAATPGVVAPGERVFYVLKLANRGTTNLDGVSLRATVPEGLSAFGTDAISANGSCAGTCNSGDVLTWDLGSLAPGEARSVFFSAAVSGGLPDGAEIVLGAIASDDGFELAAASGSVVVDATPALALSLRPDRDPAAPGETVEFTAIYANRSAAGLPGVVLRATLEDPTQLVSASDGGVLVGNAVEWALGTLGPGASGSRRVSIQVDPAAMPGDFLSADVEIVDGSVAPNRAQARAISVIDPDGPLSVSATVFPDSVAAGERLSYAITISNQGLSDRTGVILEVGAPDGVSSFGTDVISGGGTCSGTCTAGEVIRWPLGTVFAGQSRTVLFSAVVTSAPDGTQLRLPAVVRDDAGNAATAERSAIVDATPTLALSLSGAPTQGAGGIATYTAVFGNRSAVSVPGVVMRAPLEDPGQLVSASGGGVLVGETVEWSIGTLAPGQTGTRTFSLQVSPTLPAGEVLRGEAEIVDASVDENAARASATTRIENDPPMTLQAVVLPATALPGAAVTILLSVENQTGVELTPTSLVAQLPDHVNSIAAQDGGACSGTCTAGEIVYWSLGTLAVGETRSVAVLATLGGQAPAGTPLAVQAIASNPGFETTADAVQRVGFLADTDNDGIPDDDPVGGSCTAGNTVACDDNCRFESNASQADSGGVGTNLPDGIGDACQCGDAVLDGVVDSLDLWGLRLHLAYPGIVFDAGEQQVCSELSESGACDLVEVVLLSRALAGLPPGIGQICSRASP